MDYSSHLTREEVEKFFFTILMDNIPDRIYFKDIMGKYIRINKASAKIRGCDNPEEAVGKSDFDYFTDEHALQAFEDEQQIIKTGKGLINIEEKQTWLNGNIEWVSTTKIPVHDPHGNIIGTLGITRDITEKKLIQERIEQGTLQLEKYSQELKVANDTKDKLFSIIAHDLRSPFTIFLGLSDILANEYETLSPGEIKEYTCELNESLNKQFELLTDLLDWARVHNKDFELKVENVQLKNVLEDAIGTMIAVARRKDITIINNLSDDITFSADPCMLRMVLRNLISNSIKFCRQGGRIEVLASRKGPLFEIIVKDNGVGVQPENISKLFSTTRYSTCGTDNEKGTGLGLSFCKEVIEKHKGTIRVESNPGIGSDFIFTIPA